jgi:predicted oxidoreductase
VVGRRSGRGHLSSDLLVIGGGFAGMAAAARAAELGAAVTVVEKAEHLGGSAALSAGIVFSAPDLAAYRRLCPDGDPELGRVLVQGFDAAVAEVERAGVEVSERWSHAREADARIASTESLAALVDVIAGWGVNGPRLRATIEHANAGEGPSLREPPFHALEVQPSITFTFGGLRADADGRVLRADGGPVPGLYVAGADLGGLQE